MESILSKIQKELKAPKGQQNSFGNYRYRSCEDILEAVKPLLNGAVLTLDDEIVLIGDRYYVKATATLSEPYKAEKRDETLRIVTEEIKIHKTLVSAYAREALEKKGMDASQITGAASSYARKYALNGLFCIDDTKDADTRDNTKGDKEEKAPKLSPNQALTNAKLAIEECTDLNTLLAVEKNIKKSKNLTEENKNELLFAANEKRAEFDPLEN